MSKKSNVVQAEAKPSSRSKSMAVAEQGISTTQDFNQFMSLLIGDIMTSRIPPSMANAAVNAGGRLLKSMELQLRYGKTNSNDASAKQPLRLVG